MKVDCSIKDTVEIRYILTSLIMYIIISDGVFCYKAFFCFGYRSELHFPTPSENLCSNYCFDHCLYNCFQEK